MTTWKYGLIKVSEEDGEDINELVELWSQDHKFFGSYSRPYFKSLEQVKKAAADIERDGVNTWFWENGKFTWNSQEYFWDWELTPNSEMCCPGCSWQGKRSELEVRFSGSLCPKCRRVLSGSGGYMDILYSNNTSYSNSQRCKYCDSEIPYSIEAICDSCWEDINSP